MGTRTEINATTSGFCFRIRLQKQALLSRFDLATTTKEDAVDWIRTVPPVPADSVNVLLQLDVSSGNNNDGDFFPTSYDLQATPPLWREVLRCSGITDIDLEQNHSYILALLKFLHPIEESIRTLPPAFTSSYSPPLTLKISTSLVGDVALVLKMLVMRCALLC
jgi:hypothetical protein